jgi:hypothetical protein
MAYDLAAQRYEDLAIQLVDENDGVTATAEGLLVHGKLFALLVGDDLVVDVSAPRAADLIKRGVAARYSHDGHPEREWVRVSNQELWPELAREAHEYVGEPAVGGES